MTTFPFVLTTAPDVPDRVVHDEDELADALHDALAIYPAGEASAHVHAIAMWKAEFDEPAIAVAIIASCAKIGFVSADEADDFAREVYARAGARFSNRPAGDVFEASLRRVSTDFAYVREAAERARTRAVAWIYKLTDAIGEWEWFRALAIRAFNLVRDEDVSNRGDPARLAAMGWFDRAHGEVLRVNFRRTLRAHVDHELDRRGLGPDVRRCQWCGDPLADQRSDSRHCNGDACRKAHSRACSDYATCTRVHFGPKPTRRPALR